VAIGVDNNVGDFHGKLKRTNSAKVLP
jgi:hypothetical protein